MQLELDVVRAFEEGKLDKHLDDAEKKHGEAGVTFLTPLSRESLADSGLPDYLIQGLPCPTPSQLTLLIAHLLGRSDHAGPVVLRTPAGKAYAGWTPASTKELNGYNCTSFRIINAQPVRAAK